MCKGDDTKKAVTLLEVQMDRVIVGYFLIFMRVHKEATRRHVWAHLHRIIMNLGQLLATSRKLEVRRKDNCGDDLVRRCDNFDRWIHNNNFVGLGFIGLQFTRS